MQASKKYVNSPNFISICIDASADNDSSGRIYHRYSEGPVKFKSLFQMLSATEKLCDTVKFPQSSTEARSFRRVKNIQKQETEKIIMAAEEVMKQRGEKGTFIVNVQFRQNATWQGQVVWVDKDKTLSFRSALELLKLIDSALDVQESDNND